MEKILEIYLIATNTIALVSLIGFIILISTKISQKNPFRVASWLILIVTLIGMYLYIPSRLFISGIINQNINHLKTAIKFSINPVEKRLCEEYIKNIQNKYISPEIYKKIDKLKKMDLLFFEIQNTYNLKMEKLRKN
ncbi:MAG: hypothetical protein IJB79_01945 [Candidatus Gastranaerophilales bacterium]|nr:hypothetical protein [Candidatus Gastranaerophilales bacterium]